MDFRYKCALQSVFSVLPKGELFNYVFQKYIAKSLPPGNSEFLTKTGEAFSHFHNFETYNKINNKENRYYEFGAGWTLTIPITMSLLGFEVSCIDIRNLIIENLIRNTLIQFEFNNDKFPLLNNSIQELDSSNKENSILNHLDKKIKLRYYAPMDARKTIFSDNSFDFISSTATLEHIPTNDIFPILVECYRILKPGGILSMIIDYQDHWSYFDSGISVYNFLKYTEKEWKRYNPSLHYQNRLRHSDYISIINNTDFSIVKEDPYYPTQINSNELSAIKLSEQYRSYNTNDLAIKGCEIVLRKQ